MEYNTVYDGIHKEPEEVDELIEENSVAAIIQDVNQNSIAKTVMINANRLNSLISKGVSMCSQLKNKGREALATTISGITFDTRKLCAGIGTLTSKLNDVYNLYCDIGKIGTIANKVVTIDKNTLIAGIAIAGVTLTGTQVMSFFSDIRKYWGNKEISKLEKIVRSYNELQKQEESANYTELPKIHKVLKEERNVLGQISSFIGFACTHISKLIDSVGKKLAIGTTIAATAVGAATMDVPAKKGSEFVANVTQNAQSEIGKGVHNKATEINNIATRRVNKAKGAIKKGGQIMSPLPTKYAKDSKNNKLSTKTKNI